MQGDSLDDGSDRETEHEEDTGLGDQEVEGRVMEHDVADSSDCDQPVPETSRGHAWWAEAAVVTHASRLFACCEAHPETAR